MAEVQGHAVPVALRRVRPLFDQAVSASVDLPSLLTELGLPPDLPDRSGGAEVSLSDYYKLQNRLSILIQDETCHLSERQLLPGSTDFVLKNVGACSTLCHAMQVIAESYNLLHGGEYNRVEIGSTTVDYLIDDRDFPYTFEHDTDISYFSMESTLIFFHSMLVTLCPEQAAAGVRSLFLRRPYRDEQCHHLSYWNVPVKFGQPLYRLRFDATIVKKPMPKPAATSLSSKAVHETLLRTVAAQPPAEAASFSQQVRQHLEQGTFDQHDIAEGMRVSVATLRRRLSDEGTNFRELREETLNRLACEMLRAGNSVGEVSDRLGFAEFRSFVRAFKKWNGQTPSAFLASASQQ